MPFERQLKTVFSRTSETAAASGVGNDREPTEKADGIPEPTAEENRRVLEEYRRVLEEYRCVLEERGELCKRVESLEIELASARETSLARSDEEGRREAERSVDAAKQERDALRAEIERLRSLERQIRISFRAFLLVAFDTFERGVGEEPSDPQHDIAAPADKEGAAGRTAHQTG